MGAPAPAKAPQVSSKPPKPSPAKAPQKGPKPPKKKPVERFAPKPATPPLPPDRLLYDMKEARVRLKVSRSKMAQLVATGNIKSIKIGRLRRIHRDELERFARRGASTEGTL